MYLTTKDLVQPNKDVNLGTSILEQKLSDSSGLPTCYLFNEYWIELSPSNQEYQNKMGEKRYFWNAFIHFRTDNKTVISAGFYPTYLKAALAAEKMILSWSTKQK